GGAAPRRGNAGPGGPGRRSPPRPAGAPPRTAGRPRPDRRHRLRPLSRIADLLVCVAQDDEDLRRQPPCPLALEPGVTVGGILLRQLGERRPTLLVPALVSHPHDLDRVHCRRARRPAPPRAGPPARVLRRRSLPGGGGRPSGRRGAPRAGARAPADPARAERATPPPAPTAGPAAAAAAGSPPSASGSWPTP